MIEEKLEGDSLKDRHKNLNYLISNFNVNEFTSDYIDVLLSGTRIDKIFLAALANRFQNGTVICELLKSEDEVVVAKALKSKWFFEGINNRDLLNPTYFLANIFPFASFSTRCKIVTCLAICLKDQTLAENFHKHLSEKYGRESVVKLLPVCSDNFIIAELEIKGFKVSEVQLKYIYKRHPKLITDFMKKHYEDDEFDYMYSYDTVELMIHDYPEDYIAMHNIREFSSFTLGYRSTLLLLKHNKKFVIENASSLYLKLNMPAVLKILKGDDRDQFIMRIFPKNKTSFLYINFLDNIFKHLKPEYRVEYLATIYEKVYVNEDFMKSDQLPDNLIEYLPFDSRVEWAKKNMSQDKSADEEYLKYLSIDYAMKKMMDLNNSTPNIDKRIKLLQCMIDCCRINKNTEMLLNVLKYVAKRHRNDLERLRHSFLEHLRSSFTLHKLSSEHWDVIFEMIRLMIYNDEIAKNYHQRFASSILEEMIHFRIMANVEFESVIDIMIEQKLENLNLLTEYPEYKNIVFNTILKKFQLLIENKPLDDDVKERIRVIFVAFTKAQENDKNRPSLKEVPWLLNALTLYVNEKDEDGLKNHRFLYTIKQNPEARIIFSETIFKNSFSGEIFRNILTHNAKLIYDNVDYVTSKYFDFQTLHEYKKTLPLIGLYMSGNLGKIFINHIQKNMQNLKEESSEELARLIIGLSFLTDADETEKVLTRYIPKITRIQLSDDPVMRIEYTRAQMLSKNLKYVMPPLSFDIVSRFSEGDYFKFGLPSMLHMCYKKRENLTLSFIKGLSQKPVSMKKHSIRLAYFLFPKNESLAVYNEMWKVEKNSSIRDALFQRTYKIFEKETNPKTADEGFNMIKVFFNTFRECDRNLYSYLVINYGLRKEYIAEYCDVAWATLKMLEKSKINVDSHKNSLIYSAIRHIEVLNEEFCTNIINEYLECIGNSKASHINALTQFCTTYLLGIKSADIQKKHLSEFFPIFKTFMRQNWDSVEHRCKINSFLKGFCEETLDFDYGIHPAFLLRHLHDMILSTIPFEAAPELCLIYQLTISFIELLEKPIKLNSEKISPEVVELMEKYSLRVVDQFASFLSTYGTEIISVFSSALKYVLDKFTDDSKFLMIHFIQQLLLCNNKSSQLMLLIIDILPEVPKSKDLLGSEIHKIHSASLFAISLCKDAAVKIKLGSKFHMPLSYFVD